MSIAWMNAVWKSAIPATPKFVAVALADHANEAGECFPSVQMLAERCSMSDRGVQKSITRLIELGVISRQARAGRSAVFTFADPSEWASEPPNDVHPRTTFTPNDVHPTPERGSPPPPNDVHPTPEPRSPITTKEPPIEPPSNHQKVARVEIPDWLPESAWAEWCEYRKRGKGRQTWTPKAKQLSLRTLETLRNEGNDPTAVIEQAIERGWTGLFPVASDRTKARDGPKPPSKTMGAVLKLEERKRGMAGQRNHDGAAKAALPPAQRLPAGGHGDWDG